MKNLDYNHLQGEHKDYPQESRDCSLCIEEYYEELLKQRSPSNESH